MGTYEPGNEANYELAGGSLHGHAFNQIQNNVLRFFFGLGKTAPIAPLIGDSGWIRALELRL